ncbi:Ribosome biogenesis protein BOP1 homolog [Gryllus bimaculatus]|nr:Ribosome biogenesis protein BOP1 homolog [Gryllus bimaculatus]
MGVEDRDRKTSNSLKITENGNSSEFTNKKQPSKRKLSVEKVKVPDIEDKDPDHEVNFDKDENLFGTFENENDSSDEEGDDQASNFDSGSEDEPIFGTSDGESEDLSFEDDSEDANESHSENEETKPNGVQSSSKADDNKLKRFSKRFQNVTSISNKQDSGDGQFKTMDSNSKIAKSKKRKSTGGRFVRPDTESVLCGETEKKSDESEDEQDTERGVGEVKDDEVMPNKIVLEKKNEYDEYEEDDTSDEEDIRNTVGNIPMNWYDDYPHVGYDWEGKKIIKPPKGDELDNFLKKMEDPNFWRTVKDPQTGQDVILCDADAELIQRLQNHKIPDSDFNEYGPWIEWFSSEVMKTPVRKFPDQKRSFIPSKDEARQVGRIVHAIKMGWIKPRVEKPKEPQFYMLWEGDDTAEHMRRIHNHIPAPKRNPPNHAESYNPPPEYLFDEKELKQWKNMKRTPSQRKVHFIPKKYASLREVPFYDRYVQERFMRCLDLYLCPRAIKMRLLIQPEDLVPKLPSPKDLQPFPTTLALVYKGHTNMVRCITVEPKGQYLASGSDDLTVKIWEVATGRCIRTIPAGGIVRSISWCPNTALSLLAVAADRKLLLINPEVGDSLVVKKTDALLEEAPEQDVLLPEKVKAAVQWEQVSAKGDEWKKGIRVVINHFKEIKQVTWHGRGDYFATVMPEGQSRSVVIHQVSKRRSQIPFNRAKGLVQCVLFHPIRPIFFVATQKNVRVYDLVKQEIVKKLLSNSKWISSIAIHPVRGVAYHKRYPLFASSSDENCVIVSHGMVYNDLLQNPLIVPLKRMSYHEPVNDFSVFEVLFHPSQPWLFSSGADGTVRLYT